MHRKPGIAVTRMLGLSVSLLGLMLALALPVAPQALGAGDVNQGSCPNEGNTGFSAELPDCRAYEQVSPQFKNGFPVVPSGIVGERLQAFSLGLFAGVVEYPGILNNFYAMSRTDNGWITEALNDAPLAEFGYSNFPVSVQLTAEGASLMQLHPVSTSVYARDLYIHEPGDSFVPVGPMLPPSAIPPTPTGSGEFGPTAAQSDDFVDASGQFSHVLFTLRATSDTEAPGVTSDLWPGDTTHLSESGAGWSLYEYAGVDNTAPTLVGIDNSGHLISDCEIAPGGGAGEGKNGPGNHFNVMSEDGERVFFTAVGEGKPFNQACEGAGRLPLVDELFARENGSHTVAISEPAALSPFAPEPDAGCSSTLCIKDITETANFRDANFEKASKTGSKVFFSSTQQLLNNATQDSEPEDGAVPRGGQKGCPKTAGTNGCNLYEYDFEGNAETGKPVGLVLASGSESTGIEPRVQGVAAVSEDGSHVYFVAKGVLTETPNDQGRKATEGGDNLYVFDTDTGKKAFVATLGESDASQWAFNGRPRGGGGPMNVTDDGEFLVFTSVEHLVAHDSSTVQQVFCYDAVTGALVRVSLGNEGHVGLGASEIARRLSSEESEPVEGDSHPAVSEDGSTVVFFSSEALVPGALNNKCIAESSGTCTEYAYNVYEYREGRLYLISHGGAIFEAPLISTSGKDIFFSTVERLAAQDEDTLTDIYDARVDGGFAAPVHTECSGEGCQGSTGAAPVFGAPASVTFTGSGNPASPLQATTTPKKVVAKCSKGRKRSRGKCVKRKAGSKKKANTRRVKARKGDR